MELIVEISRIRKRCTLERKNGGEESSDVMVRRTVVFILLLWIADAGGTLCVWRGAPYDASPDIGPSFWHYELWRLPYWAFCFLLAASIWLLIWNVQRLAGRHAYETRYKVKKTALKLLGLVLA